MTAKIALRAAAVLATTSALAAALAGCTSSGTTTAAHTPSASAAPSASGTASATASTPTGASGRPEPSDGGSPGHPEATAEAADKFGLPQARLDLAVIAVRVRMLQVGGLTGSNLAGTDPEPKPLNQGGHLDPSMIQLFATRLGTPVARARTIMAFLVDEWNEYDSDAEQQNPGSYQRIAQYMAPQLHITRARADWLESLLISRPAAGPADPIFTAVAASVHVTPARLGTVVDAMKFQPR